MTTFSSDPEADADELCDHDLLSAYLTSDDAAHTNATEAARPFDWPPESHRKENLSLDPAIAAWFQARHRDWRKEVALVLRGWIKAQASVASVPTAPG